MIVSWRYLRKQVLTLKDQRVVGTMVMAGEWEGYNERVLRVMGLGIQAARAARCDETCTEHLLLGLVRLGPSVATSVLRALGVELSSLESSVLSVLPATCDADEPRKAPFCALAERAFGCAREDALSFGLNYVGTPHLLLGLLKVEEGAAFEVLAGFGVTYSKARAEVMTTREEGTLPGIPSPQRPRADRDRVDYALIEKTKRLIRAQVVQIATLAKQNISPREFYRCFLDRVAACLAADGGAVWTLGPAGALERTCEINWHQTRLDENDEDSRRHELLLRKTLERGEGGLFARHSGDADSGEPCNPADSLLIMGPLKLAGEPKGVVEIFQRPAPPMTQRGYLKFLLQMCELAGGYLQNRQLHGFNGQ